MVHRRRRLVRPTSSTRWARRAARRCRSRRAACREGATVVRRAAYHAERTSHRRERSPHHHDHDTARQMKRLLALLFVACVSREPVRTVVTVAPPSATPATAASASRPSTRCNRVMREQRAKIVAATRTRTRHEGETEKSILQPFDDGRIAACLPFRGGAWAFELVSEEVSSGYASPGRARSSFMCMIHVFSGGTNRSTSARRACSSTSITALAGDYDGDGIPEFFLGSDEDGVEGGHSKSGMSSRSRTV